MSDIVWRQRMDHRIVELLLLKRGVKSICRELHVGKDRVREVRKRAREHGYIDGGRALPMPPEALFPVIGRRLSQPSEQDQLLGTRLDWIRERLEAGWRPITVFEEVGLVDVSRSSFYRFFKRHELFKLAKAYRAPELTAPIFHSPGEALILDWGKLCDVTDPKTQKVRTLWALVGVMGFSRYMMVRLVWTNDVETTLTAIESMLRELGGVPSRLTSDNPKCFSLKADIYDPLLNPAFARFAAHYGSTPECLPPRQPKKKGKVERQVPYARRLFEAYPKGNFQGIEHAQSYMDRKVSIANERRHGTTCQKPIAVFLEKEVGSLKALPALGFERCEVSYPIVRKDSYARVANKYYALEDKLIGEELTALFTRAQVSFYHNGKFVDSYERLSNPDETHAIKEHLRKPWQKVIENNAHYLKKGSDIGPNAYRFIERVLCRGQGFVDTRIIWGLISLEKKYSHQTIDWAVGIALEVDRLSSRFVEEMATLHPIQARDSTESASLPGSPAEPSPSLAPSKFARSMDVYKEHLAAHERTSPCWKQ